MPGDSQEASEGDVKLLVLLYIQLSRRHASGDVRQPFLLHMSVRVRLIPRQTTVVPWLFNPTQIQSGCDCSPSP